MSDFYSNPDNPSAPRGPDPAVSRPEPMPRDPVERDRTGGAVWGWIAGIAVLILIGFIVVGGWGSSGNRTGTNTAANSPAATAPARATTGAAPSTGTGAPPPPSR